MVDFLKNNTYGQACIICGWIFALFGAGVVALRIWSRSLQSQRLGLNDWFAITAMLVNFVLVSNVTQETVVYGLGLHADVVGAYNNDQLRKSLFGVKPEWAFANAFVKLSILHLYVVIFPRKWLQRAAYVVMVLAVLYSLSAFLEIFLSCFPMAYLWNPAGHPDGYCINLAEAWLAVGVTNLIEDVMIILLPIPILWGLKMDVRRKLALCGIFSLGVFIVIVTVIRIKVIIDFDPADTSGGLGPITFWSILEPLLGVINCCFPVIQPAISKLSGHQLRIMGSNVTPGAAHKWTWSSFQSSNSGKRFGQVADMYPLASVDLEAHDSFPKKQHSSSAYASHVGNSDSRDTDVTVSKGIMVENRWEVS